MLLGNEDVPLLRHTPFPPPTYRDTSHAPVGGFVPFGGIFWHWTWMDSLLLEARAFSFQMLSPSQRARPFDFSEHWAFTWENAKLVLSCKQPLPSPAHATSEQAWNRFRKLPQSPVWVSMHQYPRGRISNAWRTCSLLHAPRVHKKPTQNRFRSSKTAKSLDSHGIPPFWTGLFPAAVFAAVFLHERLNKW